MEKKERNKQVIHRANTLKGKGSFYNELFKKICCL